MGIAGMNAPARFVEEGSLLLLPDKKKTGSYKRTLRGLVAGARFALFLYVVRGFLMRRWNPRRPTSTRILANSSCRTRQCERQPPPEATLVAFLESTYDAAASLGDWDRYQECERGQKGCPLGQKGKPLPIA